MGRGQARSFEEADELAQHKVRRKCTVFKYIHVGQDLGNRGTKMFKCVFCSHEFQGTQFVGARHFKQGKGCPQVTNEALVDIHFNTSYKMVNKQLERLQHYEELQGGAPAVAVDGGAGGDDKSGMVVEEDGGQEVDDMIDAEGDALQQEVEEPYTQRLGNAVVGESSGKRKEREGGGNAAPRKKMRQPAIKLESKHLGLIYPCETCFASAFAMLERLIAVRQALERTVDTAEWSLIPWDARVERLARWMRWPVTHGRWWDLIETLVCIMDPVYDLLWWLDRGGMHISLIVPWTQQLQIDMARELCVLPTVVGQHIFQKVQERCQMMLEPTHAATFLLCPAHRDMRYFSGVVDSYRAKLLREAEVYILTHCGYDATSDLCSRACDQFRCRAHRLPPFCKAREPS
ncbi:hypothetical protein CBR_g23562 [Chara braunii]|uniref:Uncharacterized protein n=1 Tax=Chara braunii TaxID=69332 RepID=A0A388L4K4_CHABU|nr:hypothetical protein CBR_g23562 [Chara braunii]|eukprot:GBG77234.1 hypothetical protein CBR_g23562 [Chara braunii]